MPTLRLGEYTMPSASLGEENPLPPIRPYSSASSKVEGGLGTCLPYRTQDQYDRERAERTHKVAILENDFLRATFLLDLGGRMWSLFDKQSGRELLETNPVFQPANLAIRNAWFSGGVEWNVSILGHCPFTCSPVHADQIETSIGPVLRLYEFERARGIPFQIDFLLPDRSPFLYVCPRIVNPHDAATDMYWWSNIAVPEGPDVRVLAPADEAIGHVYDGEGGRGLVDLRADPNRTFPRTFGHAADMYFVIPEDRRPWEAAIADDGKGLLHVSTERLFGRKMFVWGMNRGGRKWQEFLSEPGRAYIEIQAGLARTQSEYARMPGNEVWTWLEAYGAVSADSEKTHGSDWRAAWTHVDELAQELVPASELADLVKEAQGIALQPCSRRLHRASGWGALEGVRRAKSGEPPLAESGATFFLDTLGSDQAVWVELLENGVLPCPSPGSEPGQFMASKEWLCLLETAMADTRNDHWFAWFHLGVLRQANGNNAGARQAWERSMTLTPTAWALRCLAVSDDLDGRADEACEKMTRAVGLAPTCAALANEAVGLLATHGKHELLLDTVVYLPEPLRVLPRVRLAMARRALALKEFAVLEAFFASPNELADLREGEVSLSDLWFEFQTLKLSEERRVEPTDEIRQEVRRLFPPPADYDFRMHDS